MGDLCRLPGTVEKSALLLCVFPSSGFPPAEMELTICSAAEDPAQGLLKSLCAISMANWSLPGGYTASHSPATRFQLLRTKEPHLMY